MGSNLQRQKLKNGYLQRLMAQTPQDRWSKTPNAQEKEIRNGKTKLQYQTCCWTQKSAYGQNNGGNKKFRALRLDHGNFGWGSEGVSKYTRLVDVVYNATSNEMVRTKALVKSAIVVVDATPFRQYYENHYATACGRKKNHEFTEEEKT